MFFQDFFAKFDLTALAVTASLLLVLSLLAFLVAKCRHLFRQNRQTEASQLAVSESDFEISYGKLRIAAGRRTTTLPLEALALRKNVKKIRKPTRL